MKTLKKNLLMRLAVLLTALVVTCGYVAPTAAVWAKSPLDQVGGQEDPGQDQGDPEDVSEDEEEEEEDEPGDATHGKEAEDSSDGNKKAQEAINNIKDKIQVSADIESAAVTLKSLTSLVSTIIGILATVILLAVGFFTAVDVFYLVIPALHDKMDEKSEAKGQTGKNGQVKPRIVSEDASQAYAEAMEKGKEKNVLLIYLKKRIVAFIAVAIVMYMLLSGNLALLVEVVLKLLNGVFNWVEDFNNDLD